MKIISLVLVFQVVTEDQFAGHQGPDLFDTDKARPKLVNNWWQEWFLLPSLEIVIWCHLLLKVEHVFNSLGLVLTCQENLRWSAILLFPNHPRFLHYWIKILATITDINKDSGKSPPLLSGFLSSELYCWCFQTVKIYVFICWQWLPTMTANNNFIVEIWDMSGK